MKYHYFFKANFNMFTKATISQQRHLHGFSDQTCLSLFLFDRLSVAITKVKQNRMQLQHYNTTCVIRYRLWVRGASWSAVGFI